MSYTLLFCSRFFNSLYRLTILPLFPRETASVTIPGLVQTSPSSDTWTGTSLFPTPIRVMVLDKRCSTVSLTASMASSLDIPDALISSRYTPFSMWSLSFASTGITATRQMAVTAQSPDNNFSFLFILVTLYEFANASNHDTLTVQQQMLTKPSPAPKAQWWWMK